MLRTKAQLWVWLMLGLVFTACNSEPPEPIRVDPTPAPTGGHAFYIDVQVFNGIVGYENAPLRVEINNWRIDGLGARTGQASRFYKIPFFAPLQVRVFDPQTGIELLRTTLTGASAPIPGTLSTLFIGGNALMPFVLPLNLSSINTFYDKGRAYLVNLSLDIRDLELQYANAGNYSDLQPNDWAAVLRSEILGDARVSETLFNIPNNFNELFWRVTEFTGQSQGFQNLNPTIYAGDETNRIAFFPYSVRTFVLYGNARDAGGAKLAIYDPFKDVF